MLGSIARMTEEITAVMDRRVHSAWLYGSVVLNDFRLGWSDIDCIVLTDGPIIDSQARRLLTLRQAMLERDPGNPYYRAFEGIIADVQEYRLRSFSRLVYWGTTGQRVADRYEPDAFSRYELAKYGKSIYGGEDRSIFAAPSGEELTAAVRAHYASIRTYAVQTDESLYACGWLLDIARCVYTLRYKDVIAKTQAGIWALEQHLFPNEEALRKTIEIRKQPLLFKDRDDIKQWLKGLGPTVQRCADVLERELRIG